MTTTPGRPTSVLPIAAGTYELDPSRSAVHFQIRLIGAKKVSGRFTTFGASLTVGSSLEDVAVCATVDLRSIHTDHADRDAHLLEMEIFQRGDGVTELRSTGVRAAGSRSYVMDGELTMGGVTKPIALDADLEGAVTDPNDARSRIRFAARTRVRRRDFGIHFGAPLGLDRWTPAQKVQIGVDAVFLAPG